MRQLFTDTAAAALPDTPGASAFGLALTAFDGTVIHLPASKENLAAFTTRAFRSGLSGAALASAIRLSSW